jgi:Na+-transporting NADH:ubiquinone oxidoreductase subunit NqrB
MCRDDIATEDEDTLVDHADAFVERTLASQSGFIRSERIDASVVRMMMLVWNAVDTTMFDIGPRWWS